jgi:hypothetical protein
VLSHKYGQGHNAFSCRVVRRAGVCVAATQVVFWTWTFPMNRETRNWQALPQQWEPLRAQWEYSHAVAALLNLAALVLLLLSLLDALRDERAQFASANRA